MRVAIDVDGVCADLLTTWLAHYNADYSDDLTAEGVSDWNLERYVKKACGEKIYDYLHRPGLYDTVTPVEGSREGVRALRDAGHEIVFVTAASQEHAGEKMAWLDWWGFLKAAHGFSTEYIVASDKALIQADVLVDDRPENCTGFPGHALLFHQPHNRTWLQMPGVERCYGWDQVVEAVAKYAQFRAANQNGPESVLLAARVLVHGERGEDYGHPLDDFNRTAAMWSGYLSGSLDKLLTAEDVALMMMMVKASRARNDLLADRPVKVDSLTDIAGYAECAHMCEKERERRYKRWERLCETFRDKESANSAE